MRHSLPVMLLLSLLFLSSSLQGQARKIVLFEHFTQASCGPCASQNPPFQEDILENNKGNILHIAYHTSWPGVDPMHAYNPVDVQLRVNYYSVGGVPMMIMQGNQYSGSPTGVTQEMVNQQSSLVSPLRIKVRESSNGTRRHVTIDVTTVGSIFATNLRLRTAVVESEVNYATAPGSNGEKDFPNVFRKALPDSTGMSFTPAALNDTKTIELDYDLDVATWDTSRIYVIAFVQNETSKGVVNAASTRDQFFELVSESPVILKGTPTNQLTFSNKIHNFSTSQESFKVTLTADQPGDWTADFLADGGTYTSDALVNIPSNASLDVEVRVTPGSTVDFNTCSILVEAQSTTEFDGQSLQFNVISGVTVPVINSDAGWGDGSSGLNASTFERHYTLGIDLAGSTTHSSIPMSLYVRGDEAKVLDDIHSVYYNAGWSFPSLTDVNTAIFASFLDDGGNLYISGQDIGWDTWDASGRGTAVTKGFYRNYLHTVYVSDGNTSSTVINAVPTDPLFGAVMSSLLVNKYGLSSTNVPYFYPEQLQPSATGKSIFYYNTNPSISGAVRSDNSVYKTVYFGIGMEMIADTTVRDGIMKLTYQWFHDIISSVEYDNAIQDFLVGQNYPNPVNSYTQVPLQGVSGNTRLEIVDLTGRTVYSRNIEAGEELLRIDTRNLRNGTYIYRVLDGASVRGSNVMQIIH